MKILVTYQSKTGFTKKYANWISEELNCELKELKRINSEDILKNDLIIHGGWIMGGMINGFDKIKKLNPKKLIVFAVGYTPKNEVDMKQIAKFNNLGETPFFYYEGGMNPKKMGFIGRIIVKMVTKQKLSYQDNTNKDEIKSLINKVKMG
ncbi:MAG: hypothetical protein IJ105_01810 [Bacilli bacterium]|nr:hypothetical protein [Bacilli bacterium]